MCGWARARRIRRRLAAAQQSPTPPSARLIRRPLRSERIKARLCAVSPGFGSCACDIPSVGAKERSLDRVRRAARADEQATRPPVSGLLGLFSDDGPGQVYSSPPRVRGSDSPLVLFAPLAFRLVVRRRSRWARHAPGHPPPPPSNVHCIFALPRPKRRGVSSWH